MKSLSHFVLATLLVLLVVSHLPSVVWVVSGQSTPVTAVAQLFPTEGNKVVGTVYFKQLDKGVQVDAAIKNLPPNSKHAFHIHQYGDITDPHGMGCGGHFNPYGSAHGCPFNGRHSGDLGNITADASGLAFVKGFVNDLMSLQYGNAGCILGRGVIIHTTFDDCVTQPTGNAGARIAQGVIGLKTEQ